MSNDKIYWKGPEELNQDPQFMKSVANEFHEDLPMEEFLGDEKSMGNSSTSRRDFLKFAGFSLAAATLAACESPVVKTIPYVAKPENVTPGVGTWYATSYYDGQLFGSLLVKSREGRPIFIKGNRGATKNGESNPVGFAGGALHARITASLLPLYDGARLKNPTISGKETSWSKLDKEVREELQKIAQKGGQIRILTHTITSPTTFTTINEVITALNGMKGAAAVEPVANPVAADSTATAEDVLLPGGMMNCPQSENIKWIQYDAVSYYAMRKANYKTFGLPSYVTETPDMKEEDKLGVIPDYDFSKAKAIVGINADFLGNWLLPNQNTNGYLKNRKAENDWMSKHFQFETNMSLTGSNADVRVAIKPSEEGLVAAAIYEHVTGKKIANVSKELLDKTKVAADALKKANGAAIVVAGANDVNVQMIVNAINLELGAYENTININNPVNMFMGNDEQVKALAKEIGTKGSVDALLIFGCNPVYSLPDGKKFGENLANVGLTVSFAGYADETASKCKYVAPDHHYLEAWNDHNPKMDIYTIQQPLIRPLHKTAAWQESLLLWSGRIGKRNDGKDFYDRIRGNWNAYGYKMIPAGMPDAPLTFEDYWNRSVHNSINTIPVTAPSRPTMKADADLNAAGKAVEAKGGKWEVLFYEKIGIGDGQQANNPWLQELPDPVSRVTWDNYATMSLADMKELNLNTLIAEKYPASVIKISLGKAGEVELPVYPSPGQAKGTIGIALGYGRGANGENIGRSAFQTAEYGEHLKENGKLVAIGKNVFHFVGAEGATFSYSVLDADIKDTGKTYPLATTQTSHTLMERDSVLRETTWSIYKAGNKDAYNPEHTVNYYGKEKKVKDIDLWKSHPIEHIGHRWVMTIDLNTCIGCGNCVIACHTENNVPVVGKDEVRRSRDMHWLRIDRYYSSESHKSDMEKGGTISTYSKMEIPSDNPQVLFQPMLCQHCNHAPCETVCPVLATTHSSEGLNQMTYNRCIGTRYCANNCPYKVRRFNWFNYQDYKKFKNVNPASDDSTRWVLNPDVTVRSRGVMEKCSFCVQRIQNGKLQAKKERRPLKDGEVVTACQAACSTGAIVFGDVNDPESRISKLLKISPANPEKPHGIDKITGNPRAYQVLEEVGVKPNIWYLTKVRNKDSANA